MTGPPVADHIFSRQIALQAASAIHDAVLLFIACELKLFMN
jgi:hypothetical protein